MDVQTLQNELDNVNAQRDALAARAKELARDLRVLQAKDRVREVLASLPDDVREAVKAEAAAP